jgi:hypothetical protein
MRGTPSTKADALFGKKTAREAERITFATEFDVRLSEKPE